MEQHFSIKVLAGIYSILKVKDRPGLPEIVNGTGNGFFSFFLDDAQAMNQVSDASMDAVICNMALMDIPDLKSTFSSVRRVLVAGGKFVFSILHPCFFTPFNAENPPEDLDEEGNYEA